MLVFDLIIFGFLFLDAIFLIMILRHDLFSTRDGLREFILLCASLAWVVIFFGSFIAPHRLTVTQAQLQLSESPNNIAHIAIVSDLHLGTFSPKSVVENTVDIINTIDPDIILLLGDFVSEETDRLQDLEQLKTITTVYPTFAVLGNHDYDLKSDTSIPDHELAQQVREQLEAHGVHILLNESVYLDDYQIRLVGIDDLWTNKVNLDQALVSTSEDEAVLLLSHNPDIVLQLNEEQQTVIDAVVSGHTHGGQIRLPKLGPIGRIPTELGQEYDQGLFEVNTTPLYITSGIGMSGTRARLFNAPEIVSLDLSW